MEVGNSLGEAGSPRHTGHPSTGWLLPVQAACLAATLILAAGLPISTVLLGLERTMVWACGVATLVLLLMPAFLERDYNLFQPLTFVVLTVLVGITLRSLFIALVDDEAIRKFLLQHPVRFVLPGSGIVMVAVIALMAGYLVCTPVLGLDRIALLRRDRWSTPRLAFVVCLLSMIAGIAMMIFIKKMGIVFVTLSDLSAKRTYTGSGVERAYAAMGYLKLAASLIIPAFYLYMAWFAGSGRRWFSLSGAAAAVLGTMAAFYPLMTSSRSGVIIIFITALMFWHYLHRRIRLRALLVGVLVSVVIITFMTALRKKVDDSMGLASYLTGRTIAETLVLNANFFGIVKTAAIMDAIPEKLEYGYGRTLLLWLLAPVPRSMWPEKPLISVGETIGDRVYRSGSGSLGGGVPPGFCAELYWNFGALGVPVGMFLLGLWLRFLYRAFREHLSRNKNALVIYAVLVVPFAFELPGGSFSSVMMGALADLFILLPALRFIGRRPHGSRCHG